MLMPFKSPVNTGFGQHVLTAKQMPLHHMPGRPLRKLRAAGNGSSNYSSEGSKPELPDLSEDDATVVVNYLTGKTPKAVEATSDSETSVDAAAEEDLLEGIEPPHLSKSKNKKSLPTASASSPIVVGEKPSSTTSHDPSASTRHRIQALKDKLVAMVAFLDRGFAASKEQVDSVDNCVMELEAAAGPVILTEENKHLLEGRWRLIYSSGFATGSLGGTRPGPPRSFLPVTLGQVHQDINNATGALDNCVEFTATYSLANFGMELTAPTARARLHHTFEVVGANTVRILYVDTSVKFAGGVGNWLETLPGVTTPQLPSVLAPSYRSATFDVVFLDKGMRVTRGDRGEVRVFLNGEL